MKVDIYGEAGLQKYTDVEGTDTPVGEVDQVLPPLIRRPLCLDIVHRYSTQTFRVQLPQLVK